MKLLLHLASVYFGRCGSPAVGQEAAAAEHARGAVLADVERLRAGCDEVIAVVPTQGEPFRARLTPAWARHRDEGGETARDEVLWAGMDATALELRDRGARLLAPVAYPAGHMLDLGEGEAASVGGTLPSSRDVIAALARQHREAADGTELRIVSTRPSVAGLLDTAASIDVAVMIDGTWRTITEAKDLAGWRKWPPVERKGHARPELRIPRALLADYEALGSLPGIGEESALALLRHDGRWRGLFDVVAAARAGDVLRHAPKRGNERGAGRAMAAGVTKALVELGERGARELLAVSRLRDDVTYGAPVAQEGGDDGSSTGEVHKMPQAGARAEELPRDVAQGVAGVDGHEVRDPASRWERDGVHGVALARAGGESDRPVQRDHGAGGSPAAVPVADEQADARRATPRAGAEPPRREGEQTHASTAASPAPEPAARVTGSGAADGPPLVCAPCRRGADCAAACKGLVREGDRDDGRVLGACEHCAACRREAPRVVTLLVDGAPNPAVLALLRDLVPPSSAATSSPRTSPAPMESPMLPTDSAATTEAPSYLETDERAADAKRDGILRASQPLALRPDDAPIVRREERPVAPVEKGPPPMMSDNVDDLWTALGAAQADFAEVKKTREMKVGNTVRYHYANLSDVVNAVMPALKANGFVCVHICRGNRLHVRLVHVPSKQWIEGVLPFVAPTVNGPEGVQALGSLLTYLRRYLLSMLLGVVAVDDDDDGVSAQSPQRGRAA